MGNRDMDERSPSHERDSVADDPLSGGDPAADSVRVDALEVKMRKRGRHSGDVTAVDDVVEAEGTPLVGDKEKTSLDGVREEEAASKASQVAGEGNGEKGEEEEEEEEKEWKEREALLQDQGWAWVVCFGCFFAHVITGGFERSDGIMFVEFTARFQESAQLTAWPASICSSVRLLMGPLATAVSNRFSVRASVMAGTLIFSSALIISMFAPDIIFLLFSYGLLQGIGRGLVYSPSVIIVGEYFNRRRGLGVGLGTAGVGAGTFLLPPTIEWLFQQFGFRGALLILAGVALNACVVAAFYRPLYVHRAIVMGNRWRKTDEEQALHSPAKNPDTPQTAKEADVDIVNEAPETCPEEHPSEVRDESSDGPPKKELSKFHEADASPVCERRTPKRTSFLKSALNICFPTEIRRKDSPKRKLIEWSLLKNPAFLFYCLSICLFTAAFKSAFTFLPALAKSHGVSLTEGAYLLSISGVLDTIGRILSGFLLDIECVRPFRPVVYNGVIFVIVVLSCLSPFLESFVQFAVLFGLYGMLTGTYVSQKSVILVDILGQKQLSSSFGLLICFQGLGTVVGPPLSGLLKDVFGRFDEAFYLGGAALALSGLLMIVSNIYRRRHALLDQDTTKVIPDR